MAATSIQDIRDFSDIIRLLEEHPEWRADLRRLVLTDDLLALPAQVAQLTEQVAQMTVHMQALAEAQRRTETQLETLTEVVQRVSVDVGRLKGDGLEVRYTLRGVPFITRVMRRPHTLSPEELDAVLEEAEAQGLLSAAESEEISRADLVIHGTQRGTGMEVYVVTEVSWGVGLDDVQRATDRAALLAKTGRHTLAAVAGEWVTPEAQHLAASLGVWQFTPSRVVPPAAEKGGAA